MLQRPENASTPALFSGAVLSLQYVSFYSLASGGMAATCFIIVSATLLYGLWRVLLSRDTVQVAPGSGLILSGWLLVTAAGYLTAFNSAWAMLWGGVTGGYLLLFFLTTDQGGKQPVLFTRFLDLLLVFGLIAALLGLYEYVYFHLCGPTHSPLIPYILPPDREARIAGPYGQPNLFALFLTLTLLACFYHYLHGSMAARCRTLRCSYLRFLPVLTIALAFFLTRSKGGFLSLFILLCLLLWLVVRNRYLNDDGGKRREFFRLVFCIALAFVLSRLPLFSGFEEVVATRSFANTGINPSGRFVFWASAFLIFLDHPWLGAGLDNYRFLMNGYGPAAHGLLGFVPFEAMKSTVWAHNELLQLLAEGGMLLFSLVAFLLFVFFRKMWKHVLVAPSLDRPMLLYSHLFLFPFLIQSQFSWPLRHPAVLLLFVVFAAMLAAQYPLRKIVLSGSIRALVAVFLLGGLAVTGALFMQERRMVDFQKLVRSQPLETTLDEFVALATHPYSEYRILHQILPRYTLAALQSKDDSLALRLIPYAERLTELVGKGGQWYDLARLYLRAGELEKAQKAAWMAFELKPTNPIIFNFLHHLNIVKAARATGRPIESFYPQNLEPVKINMLEMLND